MFCFTGISSDQCKELTQRHHMCAEMSPVPPDLRSYLTGDGRISVAGITPANVRRLAEALHAVTSKGKL